MLGITKNRLSFYYSGYQLRGGDDWMSASDANQKAVESVDEAIELFKEVWTNFCENLRNLEKGLRKMTVSIETNSLPDEDSTL